MNVMTRTCFSLIVILCLFTTGCEDTDVGMALQAGADAVRAAALDDEDVQLLAVEVAQQSDRKHEVAPPDNPHAKRLERLTIGHRMIDGREFDFKVYLSPTVNAFAMADGTIRRFCRVIRRLRNAQNAFKTMTASTDRRSLTSESDRGLDEEPLEESSDRFRMK